MSGAALTSCAACSASVPASPRAIGPVSAESPIRKTLSSAACSRGESTRAGCSTPLRASSSIDWATRVTRWFDPCESAAW